MDDFTFQPPEFEGGSESHMPMNAEAAWILQLINIKLNKADVSDELRKEFIEDITPYIVNASMTQVSRGEIDLFLNIFEELWMEFKVFKYRKRNNPQLNYVHTLVAGYLMQNYNKSIEGWQGNHVFEQKHTYDVRQTNKSVPQSQGGLFRNKKSKKEVMDESEAIQR